MRHEAASAASWRERRVAAGRSRNGLAAQRRRKTRCMAGPQRVRPRSMDFEETEEEKAFRAEVRGWLDAHAKRRQPGTDPEHFYCSNDAIPTPTTSTSPRARSGRARCSSGLGRHHVAAGVRRARRPRLAAAHLQRGAVALQRRDRCVRGRHRDGRTDDHRLGHARAAGALPARDAARRRRVVPALLRARRGLRPRRPAHARRARRRRVDRSTARRCGRRARTTATGASCSRAATPTRRSTRASPRSCSTCARPASTCGRCARSTARRTSTRCSSPTCASPTRCASARRAAAGAPRTRCCRTNGR